VGPPAEAASALAAAASACRAAGDLAGAFAFLEEGCRVARGAERSEALLGLAELGVVLARYDEALEAAGAAAAARDPTRRRRAQLLSARALGRSGRLDEAIRQVARALEAEGGDEEARGMLARLQVQRGAFREASEAAGDPAEEPPVTGAVSAGRASRLEACGLAALYGGDLERAERAFARLDEAARAAGDRVLLSRALGLSGLLAQKRGDVGGAAARAAEALEHARAVGDVHAAAVHAMNRANALAEQGLWGDVLVATGDALRDLRRLGRVSEVASALVNRGLALLAYGDRESAARVCREALAEARARGLILVEAYATMLEGDVNRHGGARERALESYDRAAALARRAGSGEAFAEANRAEVLAELSRPAEAWTALESALARAGEDERDRLALSLARVAQATGERRDEAALRLESATRRLAEGGRLDLSWRAEALAARLHRATGQPGLALEEAGRARAVLDGLVARAPEARREAILADPEIRALSALEAELSVGPSPRPRPNVAPGVAADGLVEARLRRLFTLSKRLNSELRLAPLLDDVIDTVIELTCAERGFLLLHDGAGRLQVEVARNIDRQALAGDELAVSRSIAERAAESGEPVLTIDAAYDERFGQAASVSAFRLRSVLAAPLRVHGRVVGCVYVDHRFRRGAFAEDAVELVLDLADVAAIALRNARLVEEVAGLNKRLEEDLERKVAELDGARAALRTAEGLEIRYRYDALIGRSPRMLELLRLVDRATETSLPVVIYGESGTGKELVARALHENGPRAGRPFVPVNCAAVPEPLLEAELFGHVRGAFTGADRDRRGLFEVADGGTLLLDEIADTSPAMQTKLLRVLQSGEIRRVGGERARVVDVRVVAASNKDLRRRVTEGAFREDLFYRLHVIRIDVPPLRERSEDIPAMVTHFLGRLAGERTPKQVDRQAMARLLAYPWPGNVRELENELARAAALGAEVIGLSDLSPVIAATDPTMAPAEPDDLRLRPRVERLERQLIREALGRAGGNQTLAARALGLSRFGLQKKLKRYGL
jgi:transcriptional regulator with GAF, ATPase, and Fis domain